MSTAHPPQEAIASEESIAIVETTVVPHLTFELALGSVSELCSPPTLTGWDKDGSRLWSKEVQNGGVECTAQDSEGLAEVRLQHPYMALQNGVRFPAPPSGKKRLEVVLFGSCAVGFDAMTSSDIGAHLVLWNVDKESFRDAVFNGRSEILDTLEELHFERVPIGRYAVALFREDPFIAIRAPEHRISVSIRPCETAQVTVDHQ